MASDAIGNLRVMRSVRRKTQAPSPRVMLAPRPVVGGVLRRALLSKPVVLICAPAGFGKTSLVIQQLELLRDQATASWLTVDEDDTCGRLIACLAVSLASQGVDFHASPEHLANLVSAGKARAAAQELIDSIDAKPSQRRRVVVIDDLHSTQDEGVLALLSHLAGMMPDGWCLCFVNRGAPPPGLRLSRLRADGQIEDFTEADLRFSKDEVAALLEVRGAKNEPEAVAALLEQTQGWAVGLSILLRGSDTRSWSGALHSRQVLFEYLRSEVLEHLEPARAAFLLDCSVLPELTHEACRALTGLPNSRGLLADLHANGLLSAGGDDPEVWQLHGLLREFLNEELFRRDYRRYQSLLKQAAGLESDPVRRVDLLVRANDLDQAIAVLLEALPTFLMSRALSSVQALIDRFPGRETNLRWELHYMRALKAWHEFNFDQMDRCLASALESHAVPRDRRAHLLALKGIASAFQGRTATALSLRAQLHELARDAGDPDASSRAFLEYVLASGRSTSTSLPVALNALVDGLKASPLEQWMTCMPMLLDVGQAGTSACMERYLSEASLRFDGRYPFFEAGVSCLQLYVNAWRGRVQGALAKLLSIRSEERWRGQSAGLQLRIELCTLQVLLLTGRDREARDLADQLLEEAANDVETRPLWFGRCLMLANRAAVAMGNLGWLRELRRRARRIPADAPDETKTVGVWARFEHADDDGDALPFGLSELTEFVERASQFTAFGFNVSVRLSAAAWAARRGWNDELAWSWVAGSLPDAEINEESGPWLLAGPSILQTLEALADRQGARQSALSIASLRGRAESLRGTDKPVETDSPAMVTEREIGVLKCVAAGLSNKQIARELDLSPNTVKRHLARVFDRLGFSSRSEAADWYERMIRHAS